MVTKSAFSSSTVTPKNTCRECRELEGMFLETIHRLTVLYEQRFRALSEGALDPESYDTQLRLAHNAKESAKFLYFQHLTDHP